MVRAMSKYEPLTHFLKSHSNDRLPMSFSEVEKAIGAQLPASAFEHQAWWANDTSKSHVQAKAWLQAGYETEQVDVAARKLVFKRTAKTAGGMLEEAREYKAAEPLEKKQGRHPLLGSMKGTFTLVPPSDGESSPEDPESWEALALAKLDGLLFGKGE
jgi:hypothetical protein